ncbi:diguanylate cyclase [Bacteroides sp. 519]|uniref:diguanylate cyclase n=1 Tax=Bacteroides sp. 519 TaxID=2302937 RepID=UPI0013D1F02F|nr:diguanylate cyclase [Bacteroides sp. 519]NDV59284.1 diguanylate cyclase [Bacteroides sp. 519]
MMTDEELKAQKEDAEDDLGFFSSNWDEILRIEWMTKEELEQAVDETLDDYIQACKKLNEK